MIVNHNTFLSDKASTKATRYENRNFIATEKRVIQVQALVMLEDKVKGEDRGLRPEHTGREARSIDALNKLNEKLTKGLRDFAKFGADKVIVKCLESNVADFKRNHL